MTKLIESERLILRNFKLSDIKPYFQMTQDKSIQDFVPYACVSNYFEAFTRIFKFKYCDFKNDYYIAIKEKNSKKLIGAIIATRTQQSKFDMNILLSPTSRGKRYMSEALKAFIQTIPPNTELVFVIDKTNIASINTVSRIPNIKEEPFTGHIGTLMCKYSLKV